MDFRTPNSNVPVFPDYANIVCWICTEKTNHNIIKCTNQNPKRNYIQRAVNPENLNKSILRQSCVGLDCDARSFE